MVKTERRKNLSLNYFSLIISSAISLVVTLALVIIFALFIKWFNWGDGVILPVNIGIKIISLAVGVFIFTKDGTKGVVKGLLIGLVYTTLCFLIFSLLTKTFILDASLLYDYLLCLTGGVILGIIGVNIRK